MKKSVYALLSAAAFCITVASCSTAEYNANKDNGNTNDAINPLNPPAFTWTGSDPMSATINGNQWQADAGSGVTYVDTNNVGYVVASLGTSQLMAFAFKSTGPGVTYGMGKGQYTTYATFVDSVGNPNHYYFSYLGNFGQVKIIEEDSVHIKGLFFFQGINQSTGAIVNIKNGYFNVPK